MKRMYECENCGETITQEASQEPPECCGKPMRELPLEFCREAGPEAARSHKEEEPCQDFRGSQR